MTPRDDLFVDHRLQREMQTRAVLELLKGGCLLFGHRIEVVFPDGQPFGKSNAELAEIFARD